MNAGTRDGASRARLAEIARRVMIEHGLVPDFSAAALGELRGIAGAAPVAGPDIRDRRDLFWCSIDNDDSRDLDQLTVAVPLADGAGRLLVAIADVGAVVGPGSALDGHARENTTSVYTAGAIFPMLPERLSTDLTSLGPGVDRLAVVVEVTLDRTGAPTASEFYRAAVRNRAQLAYPSIAAWLDGAGPAPAALSAVPGLAENLRLQDRIAQALRARRHLHGALDFETVEARPVYDGDTLLDLVPAAPNRAQGLIEDVMIAANTATAQFLARRGLPALRRIVRTPKHWTGLVALAVAHGRALPDQPDAAALQRFLAAEKQADPERFPDLSLSVIKLMGPGEYALELPGGASAGHFGLAVQDYTHSTAPNRRYPDVITQRLLKAAIAGQPSPYANDALAALALRCTERQDAAKKVERQVAKSAAAILLERRIGARFPALVTGASEKGTWVRIAQPAVEGKVVQGGGAWTVGARVLVELVHVDVEAGHIDFRSVAAIK